jgi:PDZ domain
MATGVALAGDQSEVGVLGFGGIAISFPCAIMSTFPQARNSPGDLCMRRTFVCIVFLLTRLAAAEDSLHVYYYSGESIEQINIGGVTVTLTLKDNVKFNQVGVYVDNRSSESVNVIPSNFTLHQSTPSDKDLAMKPDQEVQKIGGHNALGHVVSGVGSGIVRAKDKMAGKDDQSGTKAPPDYDAQARWLAHADELAQRGQTVTLGKSYLRSSTVFPGTQLAGVLWFDRDDVLASGVVHVTLGSRNYQFPFPPPEWATTPANPIQPDRVADKGSTAKVPAGHSPGGDPSPSKAGVLGVAGENWSDSGTSGVKILEVAENSSAASAGLRMGYVITELDGAPIHTTDDLAGALAQRGPGSRVNVTYLFRTNLGWMAKQTSLILARSD